MITTACSRLLINSMNSELRRTRDTLYTKVNTTTDCETLGDRHAANTKLPANCSIRHQHQLQHVINVHVITEKMGSVSNWSDIQASIAGDSDDAAYDERPKSYVRRPTTTYGRLRPIRFVGIGVRRLPKSLCLSFISCDLISRPQLLSVRAYLCHCACRCARASVAKRNDCVTGGMAPCRSYCVDLRQCTLCRRPTEDAGHFAGHSHKRQELRPSINAMTNRRYYFHSCIRHARSAWHLRAYVMPGAMFLFTCKWFFNYAPFLALKWLKSADNSTVESLWLVTGYDYYEANQNTNAQM